MIKNSKKYLLIGVILIIISLCASIILSWFSNKNELQVISSIDTFENNILITNNNDNKLSIIQVDNLGNEVSSIVFPLEDTIDDRKVYNNCLDILTTDNNVYIHLVTLNSSNGTIFDEKILLCDFNNKILIKQWDMPTIETDFEQIAFGCTIINDNLYYISFNDDNTVNLNKIDTFNNHSIEKTFSLDNYNIIDWAIMQDLTIIGYSSYQGIVDFSNNVPQKVYPVNEENTSIVNFDYTPNGIVYLTDLVTNQNIIYNLNDNTFNSFSLDKTLEYTLINPVSSDDNLQDNILETSSLKNISYIDNTSFVAVCDFQSDYNRIATYIDGKLSIIDSINYNRFNKQTIQKYFVIFLIISIIVALIVVNYLKNERYVSITIKIGALSGVIITIGIAFIIGNVELKVYKSLEYESLKKDMYSTLLDNACNVSYDVYNMLLYGYDYDYANQIISTDNFYDLKDRNIRENNLVMSPYYILHIKDDNGNLITMNNVGEMENVPTEYIYDKSTVEVYLKSIEDNTPIMMAQKDSLGEWYVLVYPINVYEYDETTGENILVASAVIETGIEEYISNNRAYYYSTRLAILLAISLIVLMIVLMIILWIFLKPLKVLIKNIKRNIFVDKSNKKTIYKDEIIEIKDIFEYMIANITNYKQDIQLNNETYSKFLPFKIFNILGKENISQAEVGNSKKMFLYNIYLDLYDNISSNDNYYDDLISTIENNDGTVENFNLNSMEVFFKDNPKDMLKVIISLLNNYNDLYVGISYGASILAILGGSSRLEAMVVSKQKNIAETLSNIGKRFNSRLIVSEYVLKQIPNYDKIFSVRLIGHINVDGVYIKIYDILEVSSQIEVNLATKLDFENGIDCFLNNDFSKAKQYFVKVLKYNKNDIIAKEYLNMCEVYISNRQVIYTDILSNKGVGDIEKFKE